MDIEGEELNIFKRDLSWLKKVKSLDIEVHGSLEALEKILIVLRKHGFNAWRDTQHWCAIKAHQ